nr:MAG TPA: hypothetical protein [Caudoviricetes sp.]
MSSSSMLSYCLCNESKVTICLSFCCSCLLI